MIRAVIEPDFDAWTAQARALLSAAVPPERVLWASNSQQALLDSVTEEPPPPSPDATPFRVPRSFIDLARRTALHRDERRWDLLYRVLWRLTHGAPRLLDVEIDDDVRRLKLMAAAVTRDEHKMHAFVRFRRIEDEGGERYIAWYRPDHLIVDRVAPFFVDRFRTMRWSILTPDRSVHWDADRLEFGPGVPRSEAPSEDELEDLWRGYYRAVFNPARLNEKAMRAEMPIRHWATLPEAREIEGLLAEARVNPTARSAGSSHGARPFIPQNASLEHLRTASRACRGCDLYAHATQSVFGEGSTAARLMLVGEQPGDQEDLAGAPFVGPAGDVLARAMAEAGVERRAVYLTNAVKHFKWEPRGKRRIHQTPRLSEVRACRPWLEAEIALVSPATIVCLGSTAAQALMGPQFRITRDRGRVLANPWAPVLIATYHPSAVLRADDPAHADDLYHALVADLRLAQLEADGIRALEGSRV